MDELYVHVKTAVRLAYNNFDETGVTVPLHTEVGFKQTTATD